MKYKVSKWIRKDYERAAFCLLVPIMAVYYGWRMFALTPWYDELYTYYYFISRGPVYAAIHWPLPNNHVGYSVLSAFLDLLGNPYIGLRGVSFLCALANLILLFVIGRNWLGRGYSLIAVLLYLSVGLVNQLAVQGRGYTLGITCYLTAVYCLTVICKRERVPGKYYILFALALTMGLYTITSNVYWVVPLCLGGGLCLLHTARLEKRGQRERRSAGKLFRLIAASLLAAVMTLCLYMLLWLAIGSNLLVKEEGSPYFGMGHLAVIGKAPFGAMGRGIEYMLATPYIQSVERKGFVLRLEQWFLRLLEQYYAGWVPVLLFALLLGMACLLGLTVRRMKKKEGEPLFLPLFLLTGIAGIPLLLLLQCALPYYRVFAYGGVLLALLFAFLLEKLAKLAGRIKRGAACRLGKAGLILAVLIFAVSRFVFGGYQGQYGVREHQIQDAFFHSGLVREQEGKKLCVTDCDQQYLLKFLYGITCENTQIEGAEVVLLDKRMLSPEFDEMVWEFYHYYDTIPWDYIEGSMTKAYENDGFVLYTK